MPSDPPAMNAEVRIWNDWFAYMKRPRSVTQPALSVADQIAFYEIAQPIIRAAERAAYKRAFTQALLLAWAEVYESVDQDPWDACRRRICALKLED